MTIAGLFFIILIVFGELILPSLAEGIAASRLAHKFDTREVEVSLSSSPRFELAFGHADDLSAVVRHAKIGGLRAQELKLSGHDAQLDCAALLQGKLRLEQGRDMTLLGTFDADGLREALAAKLKQADNLQVIITDDNIVASAEVKVLGHKTGISLSGRIVAEDGSLYFITDQLDAEESPFGSLHLGDAVGKIQLLKPEQMPLAMRVKRVEQQAGTIMVVAEEPVQD